ncbi:adenylate/guanylate cyclase domain-containing protein [Inquilinus sp. OTU3971]|uniref:adenylate/guanylate cyclase domain-containing protein n=1 Tax=Inquilinus sp. OTU3971 TaxID=3043855 RepID=UPI00313B56A5
MSEQQITRRLAAILAADIAGYSSMMERDEAGTLAALWKIWRETFNPAVAARHGRIVKLMGDGALVEFASVVDAVECAITIQRAMAERNRMAELPMVFRIGITLGEVVVEGDDIFGDGVNVAARLEGQAPQGGILVSDAVRTQVDGKVSATFADAGTVKLKNIDRPLQVWRWDGGETAATVPPAVKIARPLDGNKPSLAVLPFSAIGNDPEQEFFADGLVEDILTALARLSGLSVIARNSSFAYKGRAIDVRQIAKDLGVRYVLEGSVRKAGDRIRIGAQLIDATTGVHIWADRFDRTLSDIFAVQDEITLALATEMQVRLTEGEQARLRYTTTTNVEAWNLWIEGLNHDRRPKSRESHLAARRCWEKALALDPRSAVLNALLGDLHYSDARHGWSGEDRETALKKADCYVERALSIDPDSPDAHRAAAGILLLRSRFEEAAAAARRAAKLGPNLPDVLVFGGFVLTCCGRASEAITQIEKALALNPIFHPWYLGVLGNAYRLAGRREEAMAAFQAYHARSPGFGLADIVMIQEQAGRLDEARETAARLVAARPSFTVTFFARTQFRSDVEQLAADVASLRAAGVPEA